MRGAKRAVTAAAEAVIDLRLEHVPAWSSDEMRARGKDPIGCQLCWPADGHWPCSSSRIADELAAAVPPVILDLAYSARGIDAIGIDRNSVR